MLEKNKLYKSSVKCDYQQQYKAIFEAAMVSIPEGITENSPLAVGNLVAMKNPITINLLSKCLALFDVTPKTYVHRMGAPKKTQGHMDRQCVMV